MTTGTAVEETGIVFTAESVRAILDGRKTMTRRVVKPQPDFESARVALGGDTSRAVPVVSEDYGTPWRGMIGLQRGMAIGFVTPNIRSPYGVTSDRLWVKTGYFKDDYNAPSGHRYIAAWFMPRRMSPALLEITAVRVERLQDITNHEAVSEGAQFVDFGKDRWGNQLPGWRADHLPEHSDECLHTARFAFANLWDTINAKRGFEWGTNPWVWVIAFKKVEG